MGMDFSVYIGCVIDIISAPLTQETSQKKECSNNKKHNITGGNFCSICGSPIIDKSYTIPKKIDLYDISEDYLDDFWLYNDILLTNSKKFSIRIDEYDEEYNEELNLDRFDLDKFKDYSKDLLKVLEDNNVEYKLSIKIISVWS